MNFQNNSGKARDFNGFPHIFAKPVSASLSGLSSVINNELVVNQDIQRLWLEF